MRRHIAEALAPALLSALVLGLVGALAILSRRPWLFPSLGPTIFLLAASPADPSARPWNVFAGHAIGVMAGFGSLFLFGAQDAPPAFDPGGVAIGRAAATALAVGATILLQSLSDARHPPAAATTMLITLGGMPPGWGTVATIGSGVTLVAGLGYAAQRLLRREPGPWPAWRMRQRPAEAAGARDKLSPSSACAQNGRDSVEAEGSP